MLFDSTLRRDLARNFGATLVVILTVVLTMMLIRTLGQAAVGRVAPQDVILLLGYVVGLCVTLLGLSAESIPLPDASIDTVLITYTLCSIQDPVAALAGVLPRWLG